MSVKSMETQVNTIPALDSNGASVSDASLLEDSLPEALLGTDQLLRELSQRAVASPPQGLCERTVARCQALNAAPGRSPVW